MSSQLQDSQTRPARTMDTKTLVKLIGAGVAALLLLIVIIQNTETVNTSLLFWTFPMPRVVLLFLAMAVGFALGMTVALVYFAPRRRN